MANLMRRRGANRGKSFRKAGQQKSKGKTFTIVEGRYDYWNPSPIATWLHIPHQSYTYEIYDKGERKVETREGMPFLEYTSHGVMAGNTPVGIGYRSFNCSSGPHMKDPCFGCASGRDHYAERDRLKAEADEKGIKPVDMGYPPIGKRLQTAMSIIVMEQIYAVPAMAKGRVKKSKRGDVLYNHIPHSQAEMDASELDAYVSTFGRPMHWSYGNQYFEMLQAFDEKLSTYCGNCADSLICTGFTCTACEHPNMLDEPVQDEDFIMALSKARKCSECGEHEDDEEPFIPIIECAGCGVPEQGRLVGDFDLRIKLTKTGEKSSIIELVGVRITGACIDEDDEETLAHVEELRGKPMDLPAIFAATDLNWQKRCISDEVRAGLNPSMDKKEVTEEYEVSDFDGGLPEGL